MIESRDSRLVPSVLRYLREIGAGMCSLQQEDLATLPSEDMREILAALLELHENLEAERACRSAAEATMESTIAELREAVVSRDDFLSIAAHELRTPLGTLNLQVKALSHALDPSSPKAQDVELRTRIAVITRQLARLERLVGELLDVSRIRKGRFVLHREPVDMLVVVRDVVERYADEIARNGVSLTIDAEGVEGHVVGQWDSSCVDQIVTNLLTNALRYGERSPVRISVRRQGDRAQLAVKDGGIGIAPDQKARVFAQFGCASTHKGGLGLGLWIVQQIVEAHGGSIDVVSDLGAGATFTVEMPVTPPSPV